MQYLSSRHILCSTRKNVGKKHKVSKNARSSYFLPSSSFTTAYHVCYLDASLDSHRGRGRANPCQQSYYQYSEDILLHNLYCVCVLVVSNHDRRHQLCITLQQQKITKAFRKLHLTLNENINALIICRIAVCTDTVLSSFL